MELSPKQQINELIKKSQKILLVSNINPEGDSLGSLIALSKVLRRLGKEVTAVLSSPIPNRLKFLPGIENIKNELEKSKDFVIKLNIQDKGIEKLSYNKENGSLNIILTPKEGEFSPSDVEFSQNSYKYDLIIVLDTPDVEKIDKIYDRNTEIFFETPLINIDHHPGNEHFGTVNLVDITATSTAEILVSIIESLGQNIFDEDIATCLLAGLTDDTGSFKKSNTTPKSLTVAAQLLALGARQQEIIQNFYKEKPLPLLRLWGKILSYIRQVPSIKLVWSVISYQDLKENQAELEDVKKIVDELLITISEATITLLLIEYEPNKILSILRTKLDENASSIAKLFGGEGETYSAAFELSGPINEVEKRIITKIQESKGLRERELNYVKSSQDELKKTETETKEIFPIKEEVKDTEIEEDEEEIPESEKEITAPGSPSVGVWRPEEEKETKDNSLNSE